MKELRILVAEDAEASRARIIGQALLSVDGGLLLKFHDYTLKAIAGGRRHFSIDLSECRRMDSTFIGILTRLVRHAGVTVELINPGDQHLRCLKAVGVEALFTFRRMAPQKAAGEPLTGPAPDRAAMKDMIRAVHREIMAASPREGAVFRDLVDLLEEDDPH